MTHENDYHRNNPVYCTLMLKNRFWTIAVVASFSGLLGACNQPSSTTQASPTAIAAVSPHSDTASSPGPKVVATTAVLCDLTRQIAATTIDLICPIPSGSDPHIYEPKPGDRKTIEEAKLVLYNGYHFESSLIKIIHSTSTTAPKIAVGEVAVPNPQTLKEDGQTEADPHVWHNAQNGIRMVETIQSELAKVAPQQTALYAKNAQTITTEIDQIDTWIKVQVATIPPASRKLVTTHAALGYYAQAYNIPLEGALEGVSTDEKPTARRVADLVRMIQATRVPTIFAEFTINPKLIEIVAKDAKVKVSDQELFTDELGVPGSEGATYQKMLIANTQAIVEGLGGKYRAFQIQK
jgi:manganese/iron transport system substrate-binding protein